MKRFLAYFLLSFLLMAVVVNASEYANISLTKPTVHRINIDVGGRCCGVFSISTKVGHWLNGTCQYEKETPAHDVSACDVSPFGMFALDGAVLEKLVGNSWDCAATHARSFSDAGGLDPFKLVKNAQGHYVNSAPSSGSISCRVCRA